MIKDILKFIKHDIWRMDLKKVTRKKSFFIRQLRIIILAVKGFDEDNCLLRASSITFYSLLSIVPVIAMAFGISKGFGMEERLKNQLENQLAAHPDVLETVTEFSMTLLENTQGGWIAGVGLVFLLWSVVKVLNHIEMTFNAIWGVTKGRAWVRKFTEYLSVMLLAPLLVILSGTLTVLVSNKANATIENIEWLSFMSGWFEKFMGITPYIVIWLLFTFLYMAMPNTKVKFKSALIAGIVAGTMYQILEILYIDFQLGAVKFNAIYGSFAALPLFLIWMQTSWMIVLFGAELSFANQNVDRYVFESETKNISVRHKQKITLLVLHSIAKRFEQGEDPMTTDDICSIHQIPIRLANEIIQDLLDAKLIVKLEHEGKEDLKFHPAKDITEYNIYRLKKTLDFKGNEDIPVLETEAWDAIVKTFESFDNVCDTHPDNKNITQIASDKPKT